MRLYGRASPIRDSVVVPSELEAREAANPDILSCLADNLAQNILDGARFVLNERLLEKAQLLWVTLGDSSHFLDGDIQRVGRCYLKGNLLGEFLEIVRASHEVRLAIDF